MNGKTLDEIIATLEELELLDLEEQEEWTVEDALEVWDLGGRRCQG